MVSEWPRQRTKTQIALKKKRPLEDKILTAIEKRVSHIEEILKPAAENSSVSRNITEEAAETAQALAKVCISLLLVCCQMSMYNFSLSFFFLVCAGVQSHPDPGQAHQDGLCTPRLPHPVRFTATG